MHTIWRFSIFKGYGYYKMYNIFTLHILNHLWSFFFFFLFFFKAPPMHMEVPKLGIKLKLQLPAYTTATATPYLSCICDLHHSSWQCQILNQLIEARGQTHILMDPSQVCYHQPQWELPGELFKKNIIQTPFLGFMLKLSRLKSFRAEPKRGQLAKA